jgi:hypothetical protein
MHKAQREERVGFYGKSLGFGNLLPEELVALP